MNYTPGPWEVKEDTFNFVVVDKEGTVVVEYIVNEANARLIASAPKMYKALVSAVEYFEADYNRPDWYDAAVDAIADP